MNSSTERVIEDDSNLSLQQTWCTPTGGPAIIKKTIVSVAANERKKIVEAINAGHIEVVTTTSVDMADK